MIISALLANVLAQPAQTIASLYTKTEYKIAMRDGVKLHTAVYTPKKSGKHPIIMERTPYSAWPYGRDKLPRGFDGSDKFVDDGFIFVIQDVRGCYMSEGVFEDVRPQLSSGSPKTAIDESTDAYDTIDFLVKNVPSNNGKVGIWGISYPGFYAAAAAINSHPALKAVSPQAPVSDWWRGDDDHHNGALFLQDCFGFNVGGFGWPRTGPATEEPPGESVNYDNAYDFYLGMGPLPNFDKKYFKGRHAYWKNVMANESYNAFWQARDLGRHMKNVHCAVLTVGGHFDAEDMYGAYNIFHNTGKLNPKIDNYLVMGPWSHGMWAGPQQKLGGFSFGSNTGDYYREQIEYPFFKKYLLGEGDPKLAKATMFETGANRWRTFETWPPKGTTPFTVFFDSNRSLAFAKPTQADKQSYVSDPAKPVPYTIPVPKHRNTAYMIEDQRKFDSVEGIATYRSTPLATDLHLAGIVNVDLWVSTPATDADFIVKVIDEAQDGTQMLVRWEVMRAKFSHDPTKPTPLKPNVPNEVKFTLNPVVHEFQSGHRLMVRVQSSMFPLIDRNPQSFVNIYTAQESDFKAAKIDILSGGDHASKIEFLKLTN
jgi:putative CocE/NonD family hydrolase